MTKQSNKIVAFLLCLFLGYFGVHKFYEGKKGMGILYLCTLGLFGIGWLVDTIILLLKLLKKQPEAPSYGQTYGGYNGYPVGNFYGQPQVTRPNADVSPRPKISTAESRQRQTVFSAAVTAIPKYEIQLSWEPVKRRHPAGMPIEKFTNITRATNLHSLFPLVVLDVETTGLDANTCEILEISAIKYEENFRAVSCYTSLVKPSCPIPPAATAVNHITDFMVANSPAFYQLIPSLSAFLAGCNIAGHNLHFDLNFLYASGLDLDSKVRYYDTLDLAKKTLSNDSKKFDPAAGKFKKPDTYNVENYKLETLCAYYGIVPDGVHRSLSDCYATGQIFERIIRDKTA